MLCFVISKSVRYIPLKFNSLFYKHLEVDIVQSKFVMVFPSLQKQVKRKAPMSENKENGKSKSKQAKEDHTGSFSLDR